MLLLALPALAGACLRVDGELTVDEDDRVDGSVVLAVDEDLAQLGGSAAEQLLDVAAGSRALDRLGAEEEPYDEDGYVGRRITFDDVPLERFESGPGGEVLSRDADGYRFDLPIDTGVGMRRSDLVQGVGGDAELRFRVTVPGRVLKHNGNDVEGSTVIWSYRGDELLRDLPTSLEARWDDSGLVPSSGGGGGGGSSLWLAVLLGALALGVLGAGAFVLLRRRPRPAHAGPEPGGTPSWAAAPGAAPAPPSWPAPPPSPAAPPAPPGSPAASPPGAVPPWGQAPPSGAPAPAGWPSTPPGPPPGAPPRPAGPTMPSPSPGVPAPPGAPAPSWPAQPPASPPSAPGPAPGPDPA